MLENFYKDFTYQGEVYDRVEVLEMSIVVLHPNQSQYHVYYFDDMQHIIADMLDERLKKIESGGL